MTKAPDTVGEVMTKEVVTVAPEESVEAAVRAMVANEIGAVVVVRSGEPLGVFTERDLLRGILDQPDLMARQVGRVMTSPVVTTEPGTPVVDAFELITSKGIRRLPVVEGGRLVGMVTERDLLRWVSAVAAE